MEINQLDFSKFYKLQNKDAQTKQPLLAAKNKYPNLSPLMQDTVSFKGKEKIGNTQKVKKSDFTGFDLSVVEKYRVNISGFKSTEDLQAWANEKIKADFVDNDFGGRQETTVQQRQSILDDWINYVTKENESYTPVMQLLILDAITKDLKPNNDNLPPTLNKGVLADTMHELTARLNENSKESVNFNKLYRTKLKSFYYGKDDKNGKINDDFTGWIVISSKKHDANNFEDNVEKLKTLSHKNWCTKSFNAKPYLKDGDFHIYMVNGEPKIGIRFVGDKIQEIQGERNNSQIPQIHLDYIKNYISEHKFKLRDNAIEQFKRADAVKVDYDKLKAQIGDDALKNNDAEKILPAFGISVQKTKDGMLSISEYKQPKGLGFEDFGINENEMFKKITKIKGNADFDNTSLNSLHNLKYIGGDLNLSFCPNIKSLGNLETVKGDLIIPESLLEDLGNLKHIGGNVDFDDSYIENLGSLEYIGGNAKFRNSKIENLANLREVGGSLSLSGSNVDDLGELRHIGKNAYFSNCLVSDLKNLETIGGHADFSSSSLENLGQLRKIGRDADFSYTKLHSTGNIEKIDGIIIAEDCPISVLDFEDAITGGNYLEDMLYGKNDNEFDEPIQRHDRWSMNDKDSEINSMEDFERYLENL